MTKSVKSFRKADRFHFGFCNACERYACGESADQIRSTPTKDVAGCYSETEINAVIAGIHAALAAVVDGEIDSAMQTAIEFGLSDDLRHDLRELVLDS
jgi:hypothetical protein